MKRESPALDLFPRDVAAPDRQEPVTVFVYPKRHESMLQHFDTREQQANQMHHMLPPNLALVPQVLFELLELREYVGVVRTVDVLRKEDVAHFGQLVRQWRVRFHKWRIQAFEHVWVGLKCQTDEFLNLPIDFFILGLQLLGNTS